MPFTVTGLDPEEFKPFFALSDDELQNRRIVRKTVDAGARCPCRVTLEDAEPGETVLLLNYESHKAETPYRNAYAIYVRESASRAASFRNELPPVLTGRPIALRIFDRDGNLIGADLSLGEGDLEDKIEIAFLNPDAAYIHAHNAAHGCFAAEIRREPPKL